MRTLPAWLSYLETLHPKTIDLGLDRIRTVATRLHLLPFSTPTITVAGTNGKGSTVATLESIYHAAGYQVASYTSPHLLCFNERIKINQQAVMDAPLCEAFAVIEAARDDITLTYFEFATLAALLIFQQHALDLIILEVGMGGRLDAVNMIDPMMSVITNIALDHTEWLGTTREAIALEKAGIFRANTPVICGDPLPPHTLVYAAQKLAAPFLIVNQDFAYQIGESDWSWWNHDIAFAGLPLGNLWVPNMATALAVVMALQSRFPVMHDAIRDGIAAALVMGRFQKIAVNPLVIVDVAHNPAGAQHLAQRLQESPVSGKTWLVFSMLQDKDIHNSIDALTAIAQGWFIAPLSCARAASVGVLRELLQNHGIASEKILDFSSISEAYQAACSMAQPQDRIVVTGSFYTVAGCLGELQCVSM